MADEPITIPVPGTGTQPGEKTMADVAVNLTPDDYAHWKGDLMNHRAKARDMS